jgi:CubicO group peptidase (beta-lactamase class C family)
MNESVNTFRRKLVAIAAVVMISAAMLHGWMKPAALLAAASTDVQQERFKLAAEYSEDTRGLSVLVIKGDKVIFEQYQNGHSADRPHMLASGTKSFVGVMAMAAVEDKLLKLDERVADTITEWKTDPRKSRITISELLHLISGIGGGNLGRPPAYASAIAAAAAYEPGTKFQYGPAPFQIFGEVMRRKLLSRKEGPLDYLKRRILDPIGLKVSFWQMGVDGNPHLPSGAYLTASEWAKFGIFIKNGGKWNGKQIVSRKLLEQCFQGSKVNPAYGLTFWLNHPGAGPIGDDDDDAPLRTRDLIGRDGIYANGPADLVMAAGAAQQRLYIIPSLDMVIVRQGRISRYNDAEFLARLLDGKKADGTVARN